MKNFTTYLLVMFMAMFWIFRIIVAFCYNLGIDFVVIPMDLNFEIVLLFLVFFSMILIIKRSMLGALIYLVGYGLYFGANIYNMVIGVPGAANVSGMNYYIEMLISFIGLILPIAILFDMLLDRNRRANPTDKKTDWFYKNKQYDRQFDERADRNEYKF